MILIPDILVYGAIIILNYIFIVGLIDKFILKAEVNKYLNIVLPLCLSICLCCWIVVGFTMKKVLDEQYVKIYSYYNDDKNYSYQEFEYDDGGDINIVNLTEMNGKYYNDKYNVVKVTLYDKKSCGLILNSMKAEKYVVMDKRGLH